MHELAMCQAMMEQIESIALDKQADYVTSIHLGIGPLSGVDPELLKQAFFIARAGTVASDAELIIESMAVQVHCSKCDQLSNVLPSRLVCGHCGDWRTRLVSGDELQLRHVELFRHTEDEKTGSDPVYTKSGYPN